MTREKAREIAEILSAYSENKIIQFSSDGKTWQDIEDNGDIQFEFDRYQHRVKPEPSYRPFRNIKECWKEMLKHEPFGWLISIEDKYYVGCKTISDNTLILSDEEIFNLDNVFHQYTFADGTPFGEKE